MPDDDYELDATPIPANENIPNPASIPLIASATIDSNILTNESNVNANSTNIVQSQELTRSKIAREFTQMFLLIVTATLILPTAVKIGFPDLFGDPITITKELVTLVASVLAGPFGFIVGFYFKERDQNNS